MNSEQESKVVIVNLVKELNENLKVDIKEKTPLFDSGIIDSLGVITLILGIEKKFEIKIPNESLTYQNFNTVDSIYSLVKCLK